MRIYLGTEYNKIVNTIRNIKKIKNAILIVLIISVKFVINTLTARKSFHCLRAHNTLVITNLEVDMAILFGKKFKLLYLLEWNEKLNIYKTISRYSQHKTLNNFGLNI